LVSGKEWNPLNSTEQAMHLAALMDMNICFGDQVVLSASLQAHNPVLLHIGSIIASKQCVMLLPYSLLVRRIKPTTTHPIHSLSV
jgi:hypothetical protein